MTESKQNGATKGSTCQRGTRIRGLSKKFSLSMLGWIFISTLVFFMEGVQCFPGADQFYELLEVDRQAEKSTIKKAYRKLSMKYHPDKNPGDEETAAHYKNINRAYEVLSDDDKRHMYDQGGIDGLERFESGQGQIQKGPNARADLYVSLEEMYNGGQRTMNINRNVYCGDCRGTGAKDGKLKKCPKCKGQGVVLQMVTMGFGMQMQMQTQCPTCQGKGQTMAAKCQHCRGQRLVNDNKHIQIEIEKGMSQGDTIVFEKEAEQVPDLAKGDLIFTVKQKSHPTFKRVGNNLFIDQQITLEQSLLGFKKSITHLDGHIVTFASDQDEVIQPDQWKIIKGEGMPIRNNPSEFGDLHVKMKVKLPTKLTQEQRDIVSTIFPE